MLAYGCHVTDKTNCLLLTDESKNSFQYVRSQKVVFFRLRSKDVFAFNNFSVDTKRLRIENYYVYNLRKSVSYITISVCLTYYSHVREVSSLSFFFFLQTKYFCFNATNWWIHKITVTKVLFIILIKHTLT